MTASSDKPSATKFLAPRRFAASTMRATVTTEFARARARVRTPVRRICAIAHEDGAEPYTSRVNISKLIADVATAPVRAGVAVADAGLAAAAMALGSVKEAL